MKYFLAFTLVLLCSLTIAVPGAQAQSDDAQPTVEPSSAQLELNNRGVQAIVAKQYGTAVRLFRSSTDLGELNITYVNMGRAYQYMGECENAEDAYAKALNAPAVASPSPDKIAAVIKRYRAELKESCVPVDSSTVPTLPEQDVKQDDAERSVKPLPQPTEPPASSNAPYFWMAGGGAGLVAGVLLDTVPASASNGQSDALDYVPVGLYVLGGAAVVYGIYSLLQ